MWQGKVTILANEEVAPGYFRMALEAPQVAGEAKAGQFIHVRVGDEYDPLLRRPLSIHRIGLKLKAEKPKAESLKLQDIEILYEKVGKGTRILAEKQAGEELDILGPLGKGFNLPGDLKTAVLIAGGMGVAPLLAWAEEIKAKVKNVYVIIGARTKGLVLCENDFRGLAMEVKIATDDGSKGYKGLATDLLKESLSTFNLKLSTMVYACGPKEMLRETASFTVDRGIPCQLSLESQMGCGVGACLGCVVRVKGLKFRVEGYKRVCKDGPVFEAGEIIWE